jgi:hypothetical protein
MIKKRNKMTRQSFDLNSNPFVSLIKLALLIAIIFYFAKVRYEYGGGLGVDSIFISVCILVAFLYVSTFKTVITVNNEQVKLRVYRNLVGIKLVSLKSKNKLYCRRFTSKDCLEISDYLKEYNLIFEDLNGQKLKVTLDSVHK